MSHAHILTPSACSFGNKPTPSTKTYDSEDGRSALERDGLLAREGRGQPIHELDIEDLLSESSPTYKETELQSFKGSAHR